MSDIQVIKAYGAICVARDDGAATHRWWFHETDKSRLVLCQEVVHTPNGRQTVPKQKMKLPQDVRNAIRDEGHDGAFVDEAGFHI